MASEWITTTLGEVITLQRGHDLPEYERKLGNIPVVTSSGISGFHNVAKANAPGVVIGRYGTIGKVYFLKTDFWPHNTSLYVKDFKGNDPQFVSYLLQTLNYSAHSDKSSVPGVNRNHLHSITVALPPLPEQRAIARILGKLEDKIELNRRMNHTLESMAQALFKSWFVDFDPVTKNAECGMMNDELFPAEFVDSELGAIPQGWKVGNLSELANVNPTTLKSDYPHKEIEYIDIASVEVGNLTATTRIELKNAPSRAKRLVQHGDTIWSCVRPNRKSYLFIQHPEPNIVVSTGFAVLSPKIPCHSYLYLWVTTDDFVEYLTAHAEGSAYPAVRPDSFERAPILIPSDDVLSAFERQAKPLFELRNKNERQSRTLASIRDALLPRLLSGELRVKG